jgi:hypothetical protein|tara:strand:- start:2369 stop:3535 length:1167 start_codon:yes stop_codon:yes gene_type:complete
MTRPQIYLLRMGIFLALVGVAVVVLGPRLSEAFFANAPLNGMILGVLLLGILYSFRQVLQLPGELKFLDQLRRESSGGLIFPGEKDSNEHRSGLLGPLAKMLREKKGRISLSTLTTRTLLDSIQTRVDEAHDISRYLIGLLIFLGLLGTFWGLLETVNAVADAVGGLSAGNGDPASMFEQLKQSLALPLAGMGTAFSSSLFGLAGSLVLGFLELQSSQAHNRFLNELEEWLAGITKLTGGGPGNLDGSETSVPAYLQALLEQTADSLDNLQRTIARGEEDRQTATTNLALLTERMSLMTDQMRTEQEVMKRLAETHVALKPILSQLAEGGVAGGGMDDATRDHIRTMNSQLGQIANSMESGREQIITQVRSEVRLLARTIAALAEEEG